MSRVLLLKVVIKMSFTLTLTGDWDKAHDTLIRISVNLRPMFEVRLLEDGNFVLETLKGHIDKQDLSWTPLSPVTVLKKGHDTIYIETGALKNGLRVEKITSGKKNFSVFVGASNKVTHAPSGLLLSDLMIMLEYGTSKIPPRPLFEPTKEEVEEVLKEHWKDLMIRLVR